MEAIHAEEAGKVGHQVVVFVGHTHTLDGRLAWKQYMPKKPVKWGIKLGCLWDTHIHLMGDWHGSNICRRSW